jgi:cytochrome c biogenesis protein CcdA
MHDLPLALAVAAGTLAALNPCGFALLPVYLSALVLGDASGSRGRAVGRALASTAAMTAGFAAVFAVFGLALTPVADTVQRRLPWFTVVLGVALVLVGGWLLAGREVPGLPRLVGRAPTLTGSALSTVAFGAAYALASLGCTIGPFLAIVVSSFRTGSPFGGVLLLLAYAVGMGLIVGTAALAVATAHTELVARMRRLAPVVSRAGGAIAVLAGAYVAYYGAYEVRLRGGADPSDPIVEGAAAVQGWLAGAVDHAGPAIVLAAFVVVLGGALLSVACRRGAWPCRSSARSNPERARRPAP